MTLDAQLRPLASELINQFGKSMTIRRDARTDYDPTTGAHSVDTVADCEIKGVIQSFPSGSATRGLDKTMDESTIKTGDRMVLVAALDFEFKPEPGQHLIIDGDVWNVVDVQGEYSGAEVAVYSLHIRT